MSDAGATALLRVVEKSSDASKPRFFSAGNRRGGFCGLGVSIDAGANDPAIRYSREVAACRGLGDHRGACRVRASLLASGPAVARVDGRRCANAVVDPQFYVLAEYHLSGDHCIKTHPVPWRVRLGR